MSTKETLSMHTSYLDIYISQKIRLCVVDLEGKFQTNLQAKLLDFFVWKFRSIILIFLLFFFAEFVKSTAFYKLLLLFQRVVFWCKNRSSNMSTVKVGLCMDFFIYGRNCCQFSLAALPTWGGNLGPKLHPRGGFFGPWFF